MLITRLGYVVDTIVRVCEEGSNGLAQVLLTFLNASTHNARNYKSDVLFVFGRKWICEKCVHDNCDQNNVKNGFVTYQTQYIQAKKLSF